VYALFEIIAEIVERRNPKRERTNPRVKKRDSHSARYRIKRATDTGTVKPGPPTIRILGLT